MIADYNNNLLFAVFYPAVPLLSNSNNPEREIVTKVGLLIEYNFPSRMCAGSKEQSGEFYKDRHSAVGWVVGQGIHRYVLAEGTKLQGFTLELDLPIRILIYLLLKQKGLNGSCIVGLSPASLSLIVGSSR